MRVCMYVCMYLVCEVKVHACLWLQNVDVQFAVGGKVLYRPRTYHCVLVLRGREGRREGGSEPRIIYTRRNIKIRKRE